MFFGNLYSGNQRRAIYIAIYRLTTIIGLSGHIVVYMLNSHCKHLVKSHWYLIHAVQAGKIIVVIWFTPCKLGKLFLGFDSRRATSENYCWYSIHAVQSRKIIVGIWFTPCNLGKLFLVFDSHRRTWKNCSLIHVKQSWKIIFGIWFIPCKIGKMLLVINCHCH